jgi:hypothetical protein
MEKTAKSYSTCTLQLSRKNQNPSDKFENTLIGAIDESLSLFKNLDKQEIYAYLENAFNIRKQEIPCKIEEVTDAMNQMFGIGAKLIEIKIIETVHKSIPEFIFTPKGSAMIFEEYVASLRAFLLQSE